MIALTGTIAVAAERDVQFTNIDTEAQVFTLQNTGVDPVDLDGWRFCSHNTSQVRRYTAPSGLNGLTLQPGDELKIHLDNDAPFGDPLVIDGFSIGIFADFELTAYSVNFYFPNSGGSTPFSDGNFIADHIQWSIDGIDNTSADERSDEAQAGGVWVDQGDWINVGTDTVAIDLNDPSFAELHSPADYIVTSNCPADLTGDGVLNFFDVSAFLSAFNTMDSVADFNNDGSFNFFDVSAFLAAFGAGCP